MTGPVRDAENRTPDEKIIAALVKSDEAILRLLPEDVARHHPDYDDPDYQRDLRIEQEWPDA